MLKCLSTLIAYASFLAASCGSCGLDSCPLEPNLRDWNIRRDGEREQFPCPKMKNTARQYKFTEWKKYPVDHCFPFSLKNTHIWCLCYFLAELINSHKHFFVIIHLPVRSSHQMWGHRKFDSWSQFTNYNQLILSYTESSSLWRSIELCIPPLGRKTENIQKSFGGE